MLPFEINRQALDFLDKQEWLKAQILLFENAKKHPSYQTYNNLGYYLISEGLIRKNGKVRNALILGLNYLKKSANIKKTSINCFATIQSTDYLLRCKKANKNELCKYVCESLKQSLSLEYSYEIHYNYLRFLYIWQPDNNEILYEIRRIVKNKAFEESVSLYFELTRRKGLIEEALEIIRKFPQYLDEIDLLMFYTKFEMYEKGYALCETVFNSYSLNEFIVSAMVQCCVFVKDFELAEKYSIEFLNNSFLNKKSRSYIKTMLSSPNGRKKTISEYKHIPPAIIKCSYFGCPQHNTEW